MAYCSSCGLWLRATDPFCGICGTAAAAAAVPQVGNAAKEPEVVDDEADRCWRCENLLTAEDDECSRCGYVPALVEVSATRGARSEGNGGRRKVAYSLAVPLSAFTALGNRLPDALLEAVRRVKRNEPTSTAAPLTPGWRARDLRLVLGLVGLACLVLAAATIVSGLRLTDTRSQLKAARARVVALEVTRDRLEGEVAAERAVSRRRAAVLQRANRVLAGLDPLLSSVDALKKDTSAIRSERRAFQAAADGLIATMITLASYLIDNNPSSIDVSDEQRLIDRANAQLASVRSRGTKLSRSAGTYATDAETFESRATALSSAVAALEKQLSQ